MNQNHTVLKNFIWRFFERCGSQGIAFVVSIVLARALMPEVYGTVALVTVFTSLLQVFIDSGFGVALIQKKDADDLDFSSVFFFNAAFSIFLYLLMFFAAPLLAKYYEIPELTQITRVLCLIVLPSGVRNVQQSYVSRTMQFKKFFYSTLGSNILSGIIGVVLAYTGFGVWALVFHTLSTAVFSVIILWLTVPWRPKWMFSFQRLKGLFSFGWKLLVSSLIDSVYNNLQSLIIGKRYSSADLAHYNKGNQFPYLIVGNINTSIDSVLLPTLSAQQDDKNAVRSMTQRAIQISTYFMMPLMTGLAVCAEPLVRLLLTENWLGCVLFMRIFCFTYAFYPIHTANLNAIKAIGRSDLFFKLEVIKKTCGFLVLFITAQISVEAMAYSMLATSVFYQIVNSWPNKKLLRYSYLAQLKDILPQLLLSCVMGGIVFCISLLPLHPLPMLVLQVLVGAGVYVGGSALFRLNIYTYLLQTLKSFLRRK